MSELFQQFSNTRQDVSLVRGDARGGSLADVNSAALHDLAHELRQPLGVIESLAYYLELVSVDDRAATHLRRIRAMVEQANGILERTCESSPGLVLTAASS